MRSSRSFVELEETTGVPGLDLLGLDFFLLAKGYGCAGQRFDTEVEVREVWAGGIQPDD